MVVIFQDGDLMTTVAFGKLQSILFITRFHRETVLRLSVALQLGKSFDYFYLNIDNKNTLLTYVFLQNIRKCTGNNIIISRCNDLIANGWSLHILANLPLCFEYSVIFLCFLLSFCLIKVTSS